MQPDLSAALRCVHSLAPHHEGLRLLVLHGSRARADARADSDWDLAYLAAAEFDPSLLYADLAIALGSDAVDLVDLGRAGGLIRYRVARDGVVAFEREPGTFDSFWTEAVAFWCDAGPVLQRAYRAVLDELSAP